jgi:hypothetical protein
MSKKQIRSGDIFRRAGAWFKVTHERDDCEARPQDRSDGHGDISVLHTSESAEELAARGYWVLKRERGAFVTVYNARTSLQMAIRDGWGRGKSMSAKRRAVRRDYEFLRGWYQDQWEYIGVEVERLTGSRKGETRSLWGVESCSGAYLSDVARELADELLNG